MLTGLIPFFLAVRLIRAAARWQGSYMVYLSNFKGMSYLTKQLNSPWEQFVRAYP